MDIAVAAAIVASILVARVYFHMLMLFLTFYFQVKIIIRVIV